MWSRASARRPGAALARHPGLSHMGFTGSPEVGRVVARECGQNLVPLKLELGGQGAAVLFSDIDVEARRRGLVSAITPQYGTGLLHRLAVDRAGTDLRPICLRRRRSDESGANRLRAGSRHADGPGRQRQTANPGPDLPRAWPRRRGRIDHEGWPRLGGRTRKWILCEARADGGCTRQRSLPGGDLWTRSFLDEIPGGERRRSIW